MAPPGMEAYITVTDASGRVLLRRPATPEEIAEERGLLREQNAGTIR